MSVFGHYFPNRHNDSAELETLQTDVMRFLAIIALCLAAIFSLVQTVSIAPVKDKLPLVNRDTLSQQIDQLIQRKLALAEELAAMQEQLRKTRESTAEAAKTLQTAGASVNDLRRQLHAVQSELGRSGRRLETMKNATTQQKQTLSALRQQVVTETFRLDQITAKLPRSRPASPPQPPAAATDNARKSTTNTSRGLTLGFASVDALRQLIRRGDVVFYARAGNAFWRLNRVVPAAYRKSPPPRAYYEMVGVTIPPEFVTAFHKVVASGASGNRWGVTLAPAIKRQLDSILAQATDGEIVIRADGQVQAPHSSGVQF
ncbi:hypothetical protein FKG94_27060 [Exilibacterium tricleocarpae]|uniref:Uncharacterized protein n=1 Tax=Exilibacterium tricleocarpae TaxID=2591008 RepID=A0A545SNE7_9GAMM|nr:hypothetical protein [Exilibacterium tricleocarpae]TQV66495.1 hypothetical protein FKG94_27060 [Exilibacterium tricleocarpae]